MTCQVCQCNTENPEQMLAHLVEHLSEQALTTAIRLERLESIVQALELERELNAKH